MREAWNKRKEAWTYYFCIGCIMLTVHFVLWSLTGYWPLKGDTYNSYALQAMSWLEGRLDLEENYSYLEIAVYNGRYYISFPPFPSVVLLPLVALFGERPPDGMVSFLFAVLSGIYAFKTAKNFRQDNPSALFWSLFLCTGSNIVFLSSRGGVWFFAQVIGFSCIMMSLYFATSDEVNDSAFSFLFLAFAFGCRPFHVLYAPVVFYFIYKKMTSCENGCILRLVRSGLPAAMMIAFYMFLNYARFGNVFEFGHNYLPEFIEAEHGQFNIVYLKENVRQLFALPSIGQDGILQFPRFNGAAFWLINPLFISYALSGLCSVAQKLLNRQTIMTGRPVMMACIPWLIIVYFVLLCMHKTMGGWHFGNRYTVDVLPFAFLGLVGIKKDERHFPLVHLPLYVWGLCINLAGTVLFYQG